MRCKQSGNCTRGVGVTINEDDFGTIKDKSGKSRVVKRFTWTNENKVTLQVITLGGTITSIKLPDKNGKIDDIVTGFDSAEEYLSPKNRYYGATIGRVANRTAKGKMTVEGVQYSLPLNNGPNHLHGGLQGFDKVIWEHYGRGTTLILTYHSADLEEGYPGDLLATVTFELTSDNQILINYKASVSKACPVNMTNHSYFNLAGHDKGSSELFKHVFTINADKITEVADLIPTGKLLPVSNTVYDLRVPKVLADIIGNTPAGKGFDNNFCITKGSDQRHSFVAKAYHPGSGRTMEVYSNQPGVQFYTGNALPEDDASTGKGAVYKKHGAFCLETQIYPDAVNHENFPKVVLYPGDHYYHSVTFKFLVEN